MRLTTLCNDGWGPVALQCRVTKKGPESFVSGLGLHLDALSGSLCSDGSV